MATVTEPDIRGVDALYGDIVAELPEVIWFQIVDDLGPLPAIPHIEPFDGQPWLDMWDAHPVQLSLDALIHEVGMRSCNGPDFLAFMARQQWLAHVELGLIKEGRAADVQAGSDDSAEVAGHASVGVVDAGGGGAGVPGGPEDGVEVVVAGQVADDPHVGAASKVPRRRRSRKAA